MPSRFSVKSNKEKAAKEFGKFVEDETRKELLKEMKKEARKVFSRVNKKLNRLKNSSYVSPAYEAVTSRHHNPNFHFTYGGTSVESLGKLLTEASIFESMETSTMSGSARYTEMLKNMLKDKGIEDKTYINNLFDLMHGVSERVPIQLAENMVGTDTILNNVIQSYTESEISKLSEADRLRMIEEQLDKINTQSTQITYYGLAKIESSFL